MGKEQLTIEVDTALMERLRDAGIDPQTYIERMLARSDLLHETDVQREARWSSLRAQEQEGMNAYDAFIEREGLWSDSLRAF